METDTQLKVNTFLAFNCGKVVGISDKDRHIRERTSDIGVKWGPRDNRKARE